jgi:hypothetical protein
MTRISFVRLSVLLLTAVVLSSFLPAVQAEDLSPSVRFEKGLALLKEKVAKLRALSPLWDMHLQGIDLNTVQWAAAAH